MKPTWFADISSHEIFALYKYITDENHKPQLKISLKNENLQLTSITDTLNYSNITVTCTADNLAYPEYDEAIGNTGGSSKNYCTGVLKLLKSLILT